MTIRNNIFSFLLKPKKQYVVRLPYIDGWICDGYYFFHIYNTTGRSIIDGRRINGGKLIKTFSNIKPYE